MTEPTTDAADSPTRPVSVAGQDDLDALLSEVNLVLLELFTSGCGICASMEPVLGLVAKATDATVATANAGEALELAEAFGVRRVPTLVLLRDGEEVARRDDGFVGAEELVAWVDEWAGDSAE